MWIETAPEEALPVVSVAVAAVAAREVGGAQSPRVHLRVCMCMWMHTATPPLQLHLQSPR